MPNMELYEQVPTVQFSTRDVWLPHIQLLNTLDHKKEITLVESNIVNIDKNGIVSAALYVQLSADCYMEFQLYVIPFHMGS